MSAVDSIPQTSETADLNGESLSESEMMDQLAQLPRPKGGNGRAFVEQLRRAEPGKTPVVQSSSRLPPGPSAT